MTNFTKNTIIAAAALLVAAGMAPAQTIRAEVPFGFRASGTVLPPGAYEVSANYMGSGSPIFHLNNNDAKRSVLAVSYLHDNQKPSSAPASLTFACKDTDCVLVQIAPGTGAAYKFWNQSPEKDPKVRLAVIRAVLVNAR